MILWDPAVICAKKAEPIDVPFGQWARRVPKNHTLDVGTVGSEPPWEGAIVTDRGAQT